MTPPGAAHPRPIDLCIRWTAQYRGETLPVTPALDSEHTERFEGYLTSTRAAFVFNDSAALQPGKSSALTLDNWLARVSAEFCGRILAVASDLARFRNEPDGLCWAVIALDRTFALDTRQHTPERLAELIMRGVRLFPLLCQEEDPPEAVQRALALIQTAAADTRRPIAVNLTALAPSVRAAALAQFESNPEPPHTLIPVISPTGVHPNDPETHETLSPATVQRVQRLGGAVGLTCDARHFPSVDLFRATLTACNPTDPDCEHTAGGLAYASNLSEIERSPAGLDRPEQVARWAWKTLPESVAQAYLAGVAESLIARLLTAPHEGRLHASDAKSARTQVE